MWLTFRVGLQSKAANNRKHFVCHMTIIMVNLFVLSFFKQGFTQMFFTLRQIDVNNFMQIY